jgi:hypothetical protein
MLSKRGNSLVMWALVFAVVVSGTVMFIVPVKRAITAKTMLTTDHLLWGLWGSSEQESGGRNYNQIGAMTATTTQELRHKSLENKGKVRTILNATSNSSSSYSSY